MFSEVAEEVDLCLFDAAGNEARVALREVDSFIWHGYVLGVGPGQHYGYRVHGPWDPVKGQVCNPRKLLLDPYAKAVHGSVSWSDALFGYEMNFSALRPSMTDSAPYTVRSVVINPAFDWEGDRPPQTAYPDSVIYEAHVRGLTRLHPDIPPELQGTYAGHSLRGDVGVGTAPLARTPSQAAQGQHAFGQVRVQRDLQRRDRSHIHERR